MVVISNISNPSGPVPRSDSTVTQQPPAPSPGGGGGAARPTAHRSGKILLISRFGELLPLAARIGATVWLPDPWYRKQGLYKGMVDQVDSIREGLNLKPQAVIFDHTGDDRLKLGELADALRAKHIPVWAGGKVNDLLEQNRAYGLSVMVRCGIPIPKTVFFDPSGGTPWKSVELGAKKKIFRVQGHIPEAQEFVKSVGGRWVLKPFNGSAALSYVAKGPDDMVHTLEHAGEMGDLKEDMKFLLQEYVKGIEVSTEVWVVNGEIVPPYSGTIETKKAFAGDQGPNTGCQTSTVWGYGGLHTKILQQTLGRDEFKEWLKGPTGPGGQTYPPYSGPIDLNCIIDEETHKPAGLEFTPRIGYSAIYALSELFADDPRSAILDLCEGKAPSMALKPGYGYALRVSIPPNPFTDGMTDSPADQQAFETMMEDATHVRISRPVDRRHGWLLEAQQEAGDDRTAVGCGPVMEITGQGRKIEEGRDMVNSLYDRSEVSDKFARVTDGSDRATRDTAKLQAWGYEVPR